MKRFFAFGTLGLLLLGVFVLAINTGALKIPLEALWTENSQAHYVFWEIRLPRAVGGVFIGAILAITGAVMQAVFRNPLIEAGIIGVSSGAGLFATAYLLLVNEPSIYGLPVVAFFGGNFTAFALYRVSQRQGQVHIAMMLLLGIALASLTGALTGILVYLADDNQLRGITFWTMGSLAGLNWTMNAFLGSACFITFPLIYRDARALNALSLGEVTAEHIGFEIQKIKKRLLLMVAGLTGTAVAFSGLIGFVGLVVPHLMRLLFGSDNRLVLPASACFGAFLLLFADTISRTIVAPAELPIGVLTAVMGAPFLALLVWKNV